MRFKFRAWEKTSKEMIYDVQKVSRKRIIGESACETFQEVIESWEYEIMQCTGLIDKNGREIYEGDIIVDGSAPGPEYGIGGYMFTKYEVKMVNGCFVVECIPDCVNDHVFGNYHLLYEVITDGFAEVVGNIYENPELLEVFRLK